MAHPIPWQSASSRYLQLELSCLEYIEYVVLNTVLYCLFGRERNEHEPLLSHRVHVQPTVIYLPHCPQ